MNKFYWLLMLFVLCTNLSQWQWDWLMANPSWQGYVMWLVFTFYSFTSFCKLTDHVEQLVKRRAS